MDFLGVLDRLTEIERAVGVLDFISVKRMIVETQDYVLQSQKEYVQPTRLNGTRLTFADGTDSVGRLA